MTIRDGCLALALAAPLLLAAAPSSPRANARPARLRGRRGALGRAAARWNVPGAAWAATFREAAKAPRERMEEREGGFLGGRSGEIRETEVEGRLSVRSQERRRTGVSVGTNEESRA
jgi:hypothetical protein